MKIAITAQGGHMTDPIDPQFGRSRFIIVADTETGDSKTYDNTVNLNASQGAGIQTACRVAGLDIEAVITANVGPNAFKTLSAAGIKIFLAEQQTVGQALERFNNNELNEVSAANVEGHWA